MKVIILSSLFYPEVAANSKRMTHLAEGLKERGHDVVVITGYPYYSTSKGLGKYKGKWLVRDQHRGIPLIRTYTYFPPHYGNLLHRLLCFLSFSVTSILGATRIRGKVDVVVTISPPFPIMFSGYVISLMKRAPLVLDIQDIYPETLVALGLLRNRVAIKLLEQIEKFFYKKAKVIAAISEGFRMNFICKGVSPQNVSLIPNWADTNQFKPIAHNDLRKKYGFGDTFVVMFVGTMGPAQGLRNVVEAARILKDYQKVITFVFLGEGIEKGQIIHLVKQYQLTNFTFIPAQPHHEIPAFVSIADTCLVYLIKNELFEITIPCKTYEYMAMGKPIIMGVQGDAMRLVEEGGCAVAVKPELPEDLARAILEMYKDNASAIEMGMRGREYAEAHFSREKVVNKYIRMLETCSNSKG